MGYGIIGKVSEKGIGVKEVGFKKVKLGCESFGIGEIRGVVIEEFNGALLEVVRFAYLKVDLL